jgi:cell division protein FtsL
MASTAAASRLEAPARVRARRAVRVRANVLRSGVVWIVVLATLFAGLVAVNVAVLQLNVRLDKLTRQRAGLRADTAALQSRLSSSGAAPRIEVLARKRLGLVYADPSATHYVELGK